MRHVGPVHVACWSTSTNNATTHGGERTMSNRFLTPKEVADDLKVTLGTLHSWRQRGQGPPATRLGKHLRYDRVAYESWLAEQETGVMAIPRDRVPVVP